MEDFNDLRYALSQTLDKLEEFENSFSQRPKVLQTTSIDQIAEVSKMKLPYESNTFEDVLEKFEKQILPHLNLNTKAGYSAYITGSGNFTGPIAEFIKGYFNQNGLKWNNSPIAAELEQLIVRWVSEFVELQHLQNGFLTTGGSMSNFMALHLALTHKYPKREEQGLRNMPLFSIYASDQTHSSILRALIFLGLGKESLRLIPTGNSHQIDLSLLTKTIKKDIKMGCVPLALIGNAGTTNTGAIDDLQKLSIIAKEYNIWYHVDGAYGLPARGLKSHFDLFNGVDSADSVVINPHKWLYVPFEASVLLLDKVPEAIHYTPDYLLTADPTQTESSKHTIELSKEFRALKVWFTLQYYGKKVLLNFISQDIDHTQKLLDLLSTLENVSVYQVHPLSIGCFRIDTGQEEKDDVFNKLLLKEVLNDGRIFMTGTRLSNRIYLRFYFGNPNRNINNVMDTFEILKSHISKILV